MTPNQISKHILGAAIKVHSTLGPGLLEETYKICLKHELEKANIKVFSELGFPIKYKDTNLEVGYKIDLLVENQVIVELKAVQEISPIHKAQLLTYLKLSSKPLGLLLNFNSVRLKDGIVRIINTQALN